MYPILFSIGPLKIFAFGTLIAIGYLLAGGLLWKEARQKGEDPMVFLDLGIGMVLFGLLGGRLFYILLHLEAYLRDPLEVFRIYHGGLVFYGGFLAAFLFSLFFIRWKRLSFWKTLDRLIPYAVLVHAFGRIGCFLNGCCYGRPTDLWFGVTFPGGKIPLHPTQLYESFFLFFLFLLLRGLSQRNPKPGTLFLVYLGAYGFFRFVIEFFRGDQEVFLWGWTLPQFLSLALAGMGLSLIFWRRCQRA